VTTGLELDFRQLLFGPAAETNSIEVKENISHGNTPHGKTIQDVSAATFSAPLAFAVKLTENGSGKDQAPSVRVGELAANDSAAKFTVATQQPHDAPVIDKPQCTAQTIPPVIAVPQHQQPNTDVAPTHDDSPAPLGKHSDQTQKQGESADDSAVDSNAITIRQ